VEAGPGFPKVRNPYYSAIWARHVRSSESDVFAAFSRRLVDLGSVRSELPDAIVAGTVLALPLVRNSEKNVSVKPFLCESTELGSVLNSASPWGIALAHMLWAIEWVRLGDLPWSTMLTEQLKIENLGLADAARDECIHASRPRETSSRYLRAAGIGVRPARKWGHAKPAKEVITDSGPPPTRARSRRQMRPTR
jgi:hypothetical protein